MATNLRDEMASQTEVERCRAELRDRLDLEELADEQADCAVSGCNRLVDKLPMCAGHWQKLSPARQVKILELRDEWPAAYGVAVELAVDEINTRTPEWNKGGWQRPKQGRTRGDVAAQRKTYEKLWAWQRKRLGDAYDAKLAPYRDELVDLAAAVGCPSHLTVALAMVRGGHGVDGVDSLWIAAGMDLEQEPGGGR